MAWPNYDDGDAGSSVPTVAYTPDPIAPTCLVWGASGGAYTLTTLANGFPVQPGTSTTWTVSDGGGSLTVDGTVAFSNTTIAVTNAGTFAVQVSSALPAGTNAIGKLAANDGVDIGDVTINNASIAVTGTFWQATQPVSIASTVTVTGSGGTFPVTDSGGSLTVDAPVGTPVFVRLSDGSSAITTLPVSLASVPSHDVTNAGTFAVQVDGAALTSLQLLDDVVFAEDAAHTTGDKGVQVLTVRRDTAASTAGTDGDYASFTTDSTGRLWCNVSNTVAVSGTVTANAGTNLNTSALALETGGNLAAAATSLAAIDDWDESDRAKVNLIVGQAGVAGGSNPVTANTLRVVHASDVVVRCDVATVGDNPTAINTGTVSDGCLRVTLATDVALPAGTNAIGKLAANSGVTIGAVELAASQTLATVTTVSTVTTCSTVLTLTGSSVAHDSADSGNPHKIGARAAATLSDDTMVANGDRTDAVSDLDGALITRTGFPLGDLISERTTNTDGTSTAFANFGATASARNYVTAISLFNSSATAGYVDFRDGTAGSVLFTVAIPAGGGAVIANGGVPLFRTTANTALAFDVSAALSTVYLSVTGFKSKV